MKTSNAERIYWAYMFIFFAAILLASVLFENASNNRIFAALWAVWGISWVFIIFFPWNTRRYWRRYYRSRYAMNDAEEELRIRFARGEISKKEFEDRLNELRRYY
jgi:hypothetical protein